MTDEDRKEYAAFVNRLTAMPQDVGTILVFADWLQERADQGDASLRKWEFACRWMAAAGRFPVIRVDVSSVPWTWVLAGVRSDAAKTIGKNSRRAVLGTALLKGTVSSRQMVSFATWEQAVQWLATGLDEIRTFMKLEHAKPHTPDLKESPSGE